jgi:hypothetical protein
MLSFNESDIRQMMLRGSSPEEVEKQFSYFEKGFGFAKLVRAATIDDGIMLMNEKTVRHLVNRYDVLMRERKILKFVPASGAASRMFKELYSYQEKNDDETKNKARRFLTLLDKFAFFEDLSEIMQHAGYSLKAEIEKENYKTIISFILDSCGLNYGNSPKGLLKFHRYPDKNRYAVEEHLVEAALYARNYDNTCRIHFTVSPVHQSDFEKVILDLKEEYENRFGVVYEITYSVQDPGTDTLAATEDNLPFRDDAGELLFRPGGHGTLIKNMNKLKADVVFVKNIDNVITEDKLDATVTYKKVLAAYLAELQNRTFEYLHKLDNKENECVDIIELADFVQEKLMIPIYGDITLEEFKILLNRPIRVCGMVKNEREPGGGPFWVENSKGEICLQIVESSQINLQDSSQKKIMENATHFNPVDMVCSFRDYKGNYFNLPDYVDENTGFISTKSYGNRTLKAMELPGLWNGAMAEWITVFVEVPLATFNPVKTVFDLLKR